MRSLSTLKRWLGLPRRYSLLILMLGCLTVNARAKVLDRMWLSRKTFCRRFVLVVLLDVQSQFWVHRYLLNKHKQLFKVPFRLRSGLTLIDRVGELAPVRCARCGSLDCEHD